MKSYLLIDRPIKETVWQNRVEKGVHAYSIVAFAESSTKLSNRSPIQVLTAIYVA